jgi:hypothetical protein
MSRVHAGFERQARQACLQAAVEYLADAAGAETSGSSWLACVLLTTIACRSTACCDMPAVGGTSDKPAYKQLQSLVDAAHCNCLLLSSLLLSYVVSACRQ